MQRKIRASVTQEVTWSASHIRNRATWEELSRENAYGLDDQNKKQ